MTNPNYDPDKDETTQPAVTRKCCFDMERKYGWTLKRAAPSANGGDMPIDCVFKGDCRFPFCYMDLTAGVESDDDETELA